MLLQLQVNPVKVMMSFNQKKKRMKIEKECVINSDTEMSDFDIDSLSRTSMRLRPRTRERSPRSTRPFCAPGLRYCGPASSQTQRRVRRPFRGWPHIVPNLTKPHIFHKGPPFLSIWWFFHRIHLIYTWTVPPTPRETVKRSPMVLGPLQSQSNVISDEKTTGNIIQ